MGKLKRLVTYRGYGNAVKMHKFWRRQGNRPSIMVSKGGGWWKFKIRK